MTEQVTTVSFGPKHPRGVCSVCGKPAYDGRATKCEDHRKGAARRQARVAATSDAPLSPEEIADMSGTTRIDKPAPAKAPAKADDKASRAGEVKAQLLAHNDDIVKGGAMMCKPVPTEVFYRIDGDHFQATAIGEQFKLADWEADLLGRAVAEVEAMPAMQAAKGMASPLMPYAYLLGGIGVMVYHGMTMSNTRTAIVTEYMRQMGEQTAGEASMPPADVPTEADTIVTEPSPNGTVLRPAFAQAQMF